MYEIYFTKRAEKDKTFLKQSMLDKKARALLELMLINPFENPPRYEKLVGDLKNCYSRRINAQHRLVYSIDDKNKTIKILSMWSHYE